MKNFRAYANDNINVGEAIIGLNESFCLKEDYIHPNYFDLTKISIE